jgi:hypothetical protein
MNAIEKALTASLNDLEAINEGGQYGRTIDLILSALEQLKEELC